MKLTANWIRLNLCFLQDLMDRAGTVGKKKVAVKIVLGPVVIDSAINDGVVRFSSSGELRGKTVAKYAGSSDTAANNSLEFSSESILNGQIPPAGRFYAYYDKHEYYGMRELTLFLNPADFDSVATPEIRNMFRECLGNA